MRTIIAGSRNIIDHRIVQTAIGEAIDDASFDITEVVCGGAKGVDELGRQWAIINKIPIKMYPAKWDELGKSAGYKRNIEMAENADALIAVWDGVSKGTKHMIDTANKFGLTVYIKQV